MERLHPAPAAGWPRLGALASALALAPVMASETTALKAAWDPAGRIVVTWHLPDSAAGGTAALYRSHVDFSRMGRLDRAAYPVARFDLGRVPATGRFDDSLVADGTAYWYHLKARGPGGREFPGQVARAEAPPRTLAARACDSGCHLLVDKRHYVLEVNRGGTCLKRYPVGLGADPVARKLHEDNRTTPEGAYRIAYLKPRSQFHKAYGIDYPNAADRARYARARAAGALPREDGSVPGIGGALQIHGGGAAANWTWGCMALENPDIDELFAQGGLKAGTPVYIAGSDVKAEDLRRLARAGDGGFDPSLLRNGDLVFQASRSNQSAAIQLATRSPLSHCGIVYIQDGKPMVYEASTKVKLTPWKRFVGKGEGRKFEVKRLAAADSLLTSANLGKLKAAGRTFDGKPYDSFFGWGDDRIYCSELIFKMYREALGIEIGVTRKLRDFDLTAPIVARTLEQRYGGAVPLDEVVIAPSDMHADPRLVSVYSNF